MKTINLHIVSLFFSKKKFTNKPFLIIFHLKSESPCKSPLDKVKLLMYVLFDLEFQQHFERVASKLDKM